MSLGPGTFVDHYQIEAFVGAGSMGDVYRATDVKLGRPVAIKVLSDRHRDNDELRARFEREARAVAAISHPNVVQVFTTGHLGDLPYMAMEFLAGTDLGSSVERGGPWPSLPVARAVADAARGLQGASAAGLIHRDVKPANLVKLDTGIVKVTDFGLAKPVNPGDEPQLTAMGVVVGTPDYIAPEQARGEKLDGLVDIYALGGSMYFMLTGRPPFRTGVPAEDKYLKVVSRHLKQPAPDPRKQNPSVDGELADLGLEMMEKKASGRPSYEQVIARLEAIATRLERAGSASDIPSVVAPAGSGGSVQPTPFVGGQAPRAATFDPVGTAPGGRRPEPAPEPSPSAPTSRASRPLVFATVASGLVFAVGLGLLLFGPMPEAPASAPLADAGPAETASPVFDAAPPAPPAPPPGMLLLPDEDGNPAAYVAARPVTLGEFAATFPARAKNTSAKARGRAVTRVSFSDAREFATKANARLLTEAEYERARELAGFDGEPKLWEWVMADKAAKSRRRVRNGKRTGDRRDKGQRDVTFRLVRDL